MEAKKPVEPDSRIENQKTKLRAVLETAIKECVDLTKGSDKTKEDAELISPVIETLRELQEGIK